MKYWILFLISFSLCANTYDEVFISGNSGNRLDIVFAQPENENPNLVKMYRKCGMMPATTIHSTKDTKTFNIHVISRNDFLMHDELWNSGYYQKNNFKLIDANFSKRDFGFMMRFSFSNQGWALESYLKKEG